MNKIIKEKDSVSLACPPSGGSKVTWSRETNGTKVDILLIDDDKDVRLISDPNKQYSSLADRSLHIFRAAVSSSAEYFCNNEPAAAVTVIPSGNLELQVVSLLLLHIFVSLNRLLEAVETRS